MTSTYLVIAAPFRTNLKTKHLASTVRELRLQKLPQPASDQAGIENEPPRELRKLRNN
jgi:hypothetical protein